MQLRIEKLRASNIRDFTDIELSMEAPGGSLHHTTLIQMPNGTGKTTTTHLLRHLLSNHAFNEEEVAEYKPENFEADEGVFQVDFRYGEDIFTLGIRFDYRSNTHTYFHSKPSHERGGYEEKFWLPRQIRPLMNEEFVELFIFDGELAKALLDGSKTRARDALKSIYFLDRLESQLSRIDELVEKVQEERSDETKATTEQGLKNIQTQRRNIRETLEELLDNKEKLEDQLETREGTIRNLKTEHEQLLANREKVLEQYKEWEGKIEILENDRKETTLKLLERLREPSEFSQESRSLLTRLAGQMTVLQLPKSTSREFFRALAEGPECLCGRDLAEQHRETIRQKADEFLGEDRVGVLNALKDRLSSFPPRRGAEEIIDDLQELNTKLVEARQRRDALENELSPEDRERAETLRDQISELERKQKNDRDWYEILTTTDASYRKELGVTWKENIPLSRQRHTDFAKKIEKATDTVDFGRKADKLKELLEFVVADSLDRLSSMVVQETNAKLKSILRGREVEVAAIDRSIEIHRKKDISEGQGLAVGYAFLSTLFDRSPLDVPFIVDSPAGKLDFEVREEVASTVPELFGQLIVFIISTERDGFVKPLATEDKQFYTVFKEPEDPSVVRVLDDEEFFGTFQSEEERGE